MVALARAIYNPRPGELAGTLPDPADLCKPDLADRTAVESQLFDAFIPAAYRPDPDSRWKAQDAQWWLAFLARHLEYTIGKPDLDWWELPLAATWRFAIVVEVLLGAVAAAVSWVALRSGIGLVTWVGATRARNWASVIQSLLGMSIGIGIATGLVVGTQIRHPETPAHTIRWSSPSYLSIGIGIAAGVVTGTWLMIAAGNEAWAGVAVGAVVAVVTVMFLTGAPTSARLEIRSAASPSAVLVRDRRVAIVVGAVTGFVSWASVAVLIWALAGFRALARLGVLIGPAAGPVAAVMLGFQLLLVGPFLTAAWPSYGIARTWLALRHRLPWQLMSFLADAHKRGVLRQAGAVYQFRHIQLQHRLANTWAKIGSYHDVQDVNGDKYRVTLAKIIDPARGEGQFATPGNGKRLVGAVFTVEALSGSLHGEDANHEAVLIGSNGETYKADVDAIAGYTNFDAGVVHVAQGETVTGAVTFRVADGVKVEWVKWTASSGFSSTVRWVASRHVTRIGTGS